MKLVRPYGLRSERTVKTIPEFSSFKIPRDLLIVQRQEEVCFECPLWVGVQYCNASPKSPWGWNYRGEENQVGCPKFMVHLGSQQGQCDQGSSGGQPFCCQTLPAPPWHLPVPRTCQQELLVWRYPDNMAQRTSHFSLSPKAPFSHCYGLILKLWSPNI